MNCPALLQIESNSNSNRIKEKGVTCKRINFGFDCTLTKMIRKVQNLYN